MVDLEFEKLLTSKIKEIYRRQGYRFLGRNQHSATKICRWTKESLRTNRVCYKELWYPPVESHRCMQMTPTLSCNYHCLYCWRLHSGDRLNVKWKEFPLDVELDEPKEIINDAVEKRRSLLIGFKGNPGVDKKRVEEALKPTMMTMSLTGEPTLYPRISELVEEAEKMGIITFLVTNVFPLLKKYCQAWEKCQPPQKSTACSDCRTEHLSPAWCRYSDAEPEKTKGCLDKDSAGNAEGSVHQHRCDAVWKHMPEEDASQRQAK